MEEDHTQSDQLPQVPPDPRQTPVPELRPLSPEDAAELEGLARSSLSDAGIEVGDGKTPTKPPLREIDYAELDRLARTSIREAGFSLSGPAQVPGEGERPDGTPIPQDRTFEQIRDQFAPQAKEPVEIRGWDTLIRLLEDMNDRLENLETLIREQD